MTQYHPLVFRDPTVGAKDKASSAILQKISDGKFKTVLGLYIGNTDVATTPAAALFGADDNATSLTFTTIQGAIDDMWTSLSTTGAGTITTVTASGAALTFAGATVPVTVNSVAADVKRVCAYTTTTQSMAASTDTPCSFTLELYDTDSFHNNATNNSRFVAPTAGVYAIAYSITFASGTATNEARTHLVVNGASASSNEWPALHRQNLDASAVTTINGATVRYLSASDYVEVYAHQDTSGALNVGSATFGICNFFYMALVPQGIASITASFERDAGVGGGGIVVENPGGPQVLLGLSDDVLTSLALIGTLGEGNVTTVTAGSAYVAVTNGGGPNVTVDFSADSKTSTSLVGSLVTGVSAGSGYVTASSNGARPETYSVDLGSDAKTSTSLVGALVTDVASGAMITVTENGARPKTETVGLNSDAQTSVSLAHAKVTLAGTPDYITLSGQQITRGTVDISDDTNLAGDTEVVLTGDALSLASTITRDSELSAYQPVDATLTALAAYNTNGLLTQTAADTFTGRTITGTTGLITVTNGDGVSGNPTVTITDPEIPADGTKNVTGRLSTSAEIATSTSVRISGTSGNTLAVETSGLVYDATNNRVGIGVSAPYGLLTIGSDAADGAGSAAKGFLFTDTLSSVVSPWAHAAIYSVGSSGWNGNLVFAVDTDGANNNNPTEKMRINSSGNVGIGDTSPDSKLEILSTTNPQIRVSNVDGSKDWTIGADANGDMQIITRATAGTSAGAMTVKGSLETSSTATNQFTIRNGANTATWGLSTTGNSTITNNGTFVQVPKGFRFGSGSYYANPSDGIVLFTKPSSYYGVVLDCTGTIPEIYGHFDDSTPADWDLRIGDSGANKGIRTDVTNSRIGIYDDTPEYTLDVNGNIQAQNTQWKDWAASAKAGTASGAIPTSTYWTQQNSGQNLQTLSNNAYLLFPIEYEAGTVLTRLRVKWQGGHAADGVKFSLLKRTESGTTVAFTTVGAEQTPAASASVTVTTYDFADETMSADTSYSIRVDAVLAVTSVLVYSVGVESSKRVY